MRLKAGLVGIEVEVEGNHFRKGDSDLSDDEEGEFSPIPIPWVYHHDGSLRGEDNAEYVLRNPIQFEEVGPALGTLWDMFDKDGTVLSESNRTSVHVHLNVQEFYLNRLCSVLALYFSVEELLTAWCGETRVGNLFCLRVKDAPAIITRLKEYFKTNGSYKFSDGMHYAGLNPQAIQKLGSVEIRTLRGVTTPDVIEKWVSILERLYKLSEEYPDPRKICDVFSAHGPQGYLCEVLGEHAFEVMEFSGYTNEQINNALYEGIRAAQELCYSCDWSMFSPIKVKTDPFRRKIIEEEGPHQGFIDFYQIAANLPDPTPNSTPPAPTWYIPPTTQEEVF